MIYYTVLGPFYFYEYSFSPSVSVKTNETEVTLQEKNKLQANIPLGHTHKDSLKTTCRFQFYIKRIIFSGNARFISDMPGQFRRINQSVLLILVTKQCGRKKCGNLSKCKKSFPTVIIYDKAHSKLDREAFPST